MKTTPMLTFGSLFAGIGGFDLGFERAGMVCRWQVEIDDYANRILAKHWPDVPRYRDVRAFPPRPDSPWLGANWREQFAVDAIIGGFPCQDISYAGRGAGLAGKRSGLWYEFARVVGEVGPRFVVVENVAALFTRGFDAVLGTLASLGYDAEWHCISAASVGAKHLRNRVFIMAHRQGDGRQQRLPDSRRSEERTGEREEYRFGSGRKAMAYTASERPLPSAFGRVHCEEEGGRPRHVESERLGWWETEPDVGRVADGVSARVDRLRGLGNAVVPQVAEVVANRVIELAG